MQAVGVKAQRGAAWNAQKSACHQSLDFHGQGALSVHGHDHGRAGQGGVARAQKKSGRVVHHLHAALAHAKDQQFLIGAETVLEHAQQTEHLAAVPLQGDDRVHHVFQQAGPGQDAVLGHMAHQDQGAAHAAAGLQQGRGHGAYLADIARQAFGLQTGHGLYRVHDHQGRGSGTADAVEGVQHVLNLGGGQSQKIGVQHPEPLAPGLDLRQRFLAAGVEHRFALGSHQSGHLQEQGGFADARLAAYQNGRARHQALAQHAVQGLEPAAVGRMPGIGHVAQGDRPVGPNARGGAQTGGPAAGRAWAEASRVFHS